MTPTPTPPESLALEQLLARHARA
ncbi:MAG: hypothetical protein JWO26_1611, partial [Rhodospirillales bacterium]|nr:hypothetical protein [Rhodospirillales bacterium]